MRKTLMLAAAAVIAASFTAGHADTAPLATCTGHASLSGIYIPPNFNPSLTGTCSAVLSLDADQAVALTIAVEPAFSGWLHAIVTAPGKAQFVDATGFYVAGQLVSDGLPCTGTGTGVGNLTAGNWTLRIDASGFCGNSAALPGTPGGVRVAAAYGSFSASVTPASTGS